MFQCLSSYFSYYYNNYFGNSPSLSLTEYEAVNNTNNTNSMDNMNNMNNIEKKNFSMLEMHDLYKLIFSKDNNSDNIPKIIEIVLYKYYNNEIISTQETSLTFVHSNKFLKINSRLNIKNYLNVINIVRNYTIKNVVLPEYIYSNNYKQKEYIEVFHFIHREICMIILQNILTMSEIINIYKQMINIICDCRDTGLVHRDLKLENFIINFDDENNVQVKLIDLGLVLLIIQH